MAEKLEIYDINGNFIKYQDISKFYNSAFKEYNQKGYVSYKLKTISCMIFNTNGRLILQQRSSNAYHSPSLYDKSIGGHVSAEETPDISVIKESIEELGIPITILDNFDKAIQCIDIEKIGIVKRIKTVENFKSKRVYHDSSYYYQPFDDTIYIGVYGGDLKFVDGEVESTKLLTLDELKEELQNNSQNYTYDLYWIVDNFYEELQSIKDNITRYIE